MYSIQMYTIQKKPQSRDASVTQCKDEEKCIKIAANFSLLEFNSQRMLCNSKRRKHYYKIGNTPSQ